VRATLRAMSRCSTVLVTLTVLAGAARADTDYFAQPAPSTIKVRQTRSRTTSQHLMIGGLAGAGAVAGGLGLWFHLDSREAADAVSADDPRLIGTWTPDRQESYDRAESSGSKAIIFYGVGGLCLVGAVVAAVLTQPGEEEIEVGPRHASIAPVPGGAVVGGAWRW